MRRTLVIALAVALTPALFAQGYATQVYNSPDWVAYGCTTYPLNQSSSPTNTGLQAPGVVYDPLLAWDGFTGYNWVKTTYTDSAAAATAISTGQKTYNNAINWSDMNTSIVPTIVEMAYAAGKATGTISSVQWSHATPAGLSNAHNISRNSYAAIANAMLDGPELTVIMGAGNPDFDDNGDPSVKDARYVGGAGTWAQLKAGTHPGGWQLVETLADFEAVATGNPVGRYVGVPQVYSTLQQSRMPSQDWDGNFVIDAGDTLVAPVHDPARGSIGDTPIPNLPTLALMTRAALNVLDNDPDGFFLHVEGGAPDWANHANQRARMIEEHMDFNRAVEAVVEWVGTNSNWNETLVIVTADHECGMLWGPNSAATAFDPIVFNGEGQMPGMAFNSGNHTNSLVPVYARGPGSNLLAGLVDGSDAVAAAIWGVGNYIDNTDLFTAMATGGAKNVVMMISDGAGFNTFNATSMWEGRWISPANCVGDIDCNGTVDFFDIDFFVEALAYSPIGQGWPYDCTWLNADCDLDNDVDYFDIDPFVARLGTSCP